MLAQLREATWPLVLSNWVRADARVAYTCRADSCSVVLVIVPHALSTVNHTSATGMVCCYQHPLHVKGPPKTA
jgi:hypothetical protein